MMDDRGKVPIAPETFTIDGPYLREQAREAVKLFLAPLSGVYHAINDRSVTQRDKRA